MTFEELKAEAKRQGYNLIPNRQEKFLPCTCGCNRRTHWYRWVEGGNIITLKCERCEKSAQGKTEAEAKRNWNKMIRIERGENNE